MKFKLVATLLFFLLMVTPAGSSEVSNVYNHNQLTSQESGKIKNMPFLLKKGGSLQKTVKIPQAQTAMGLGLVAIVLFLLTVLIANTYPLLATILGLLSFASALSSSILALFALSATGQSAASGEQAMANWGLIYSLSIFLFLIAIALLKER